MSLHFVFLLASAVLGVLASVGYKIGTLDVHAAAFTCFILSILLGAR